MLDFLQMLDFFKKRSVSFVAVSQRFDTSTPIGEVTRNNLLTFAQFERQMTAERTRDKMRAARRRGKWTGGMPPLGYDVALEGGRLVVNKDEAATVVSIFELYLELGSLLAVVQELRRSPTRRKTWTTRDGKVRIDREFNNVDVHRLLTDPIYIGLQKLGGETFKGEQTAIISKAVFDRVQRMLDWNRRNLGASHSNPHGALLRGIVRCAACDSSMTHAFTESRRKAFRNYRCVNAVKNGADACPTGSVPATKLEGFVVEKIKRIGSDRALCDETFRQVEAQVAAQRRGLKAEAKRVERDLAEAVRDVDRLSTLDGQYVDPEAVGRAPAQFTALWDVLLTPERERVVRLLIERVDYHGANGELKIAFSATGAKVLAADAVS